jgi:hypothetical protein
MVLQLLFDLFVRLLYGCFNARFDRFLVFVHSLHRDVRPHLEALFL